MNNLPDMIICGAMKCGTTVLWHNLNKHPDIMMIKNPNDPKKASTEIRFWNNKSQYNTFKKDGINWYKKLFKYNDKIQGEKCANYIEQKSTMELMAKYIPDIKLILCIREPSNRAYSEFKMQVPTGTFTYEIAEKKGYLTRGKYYKQIMNNILPFFPKENLYILIQERMKNDTCGEMNKLFEFLEVSKLEYDVQKVSFQEATNRNLDLKKDSQVKSYKIWQTKYKPIDSKLDKRLKEYFKKHNEKLFEFLGYNIREWEK